MKFIHLSDLHIGKRINEVSLLDDQKYIFNEIIKIIDNENPDAVIIAGDVYDKPIPTAEAVKLFDSFLVTLSERLVKVFIIIGNHDSPERLAFGGRLLITSNVYVSPVYNGHVKPIEVDDVNIYMLPFIKPANVRQFYADEDISTYTDAINVAISNMNINENKVNILVTHQFVTGAKRSDSEEISVGGTDNIDVTAFDKFDYVALGHIHGPQHISRESVRYCGTPLKYSFSEKDHIKSVTLVEISGKQEIKIRAIPLIPLRDMREIKGTYNELTLRANYKNTNVNDYLRIVLTDEEDVPDAMARLRAIYPNILKLDYENSRTKHSAEINTELYTENKTPYELLNNFFEMQNGCEMSLEQNQLSKTLLEEIWGDKV